MSERKDVFRQIIKGTSVFGGTQVLTMLVNVIRGKFAALILGASGMGFSSLLQSALNPIQQFFSFGLPISIVRNISQNEGEERLAMIVAFRRVLLCLSLAGVVTMLASASLISVATFGNAGYAGWFRTLSVALFFGILYAGECSILQGARRLKTFALVSVATPLVGLLACVPLYYFYRTDGIAPALAVAAFFSWLVARLLTARLYPCLPAQPWRTTWKIGRNVLSFGGVMMMSALIGALCTYLLNTFIGMGNMRDVGFFQAVNSITLQCTAMIFAAMGTDYLPYLSSVESSPKDIGLLVNQEGETVLLIMTPVIALLILFAPLIVEVLLTPEFYCIIPVLRMMAFSFLGRAFCFPQDYVCIAKGAKAYFFWVEGVFTNVKTILLFGTGYYLFGFIGLGYAAVVNSVLDILCSAVFNWWKFKIHYKKTYYQLFALCFVAAMLSLSSTFIGDTVIEYAVMTSVCVAMCLFSYWQLDKRIDIKELIHQRRLFNKHNG